MSLASDCIFGALDNSETSGNRSTSVSGLTLTDNNTVTSAAGKINNAGDFERDNSEYLSVDSGTLFNFGSGNFAWSMWINPETVGNNERMMLVSKDSNASTGRQFTIEINGLGSFTTRGAPRITLFASDSNVAVGDMAQDSIAGGWHHLVMQRNGSSFEGWVNGVSKTISTGGGNVSLPQTMQTTTTQFRMGARAYSGFEDYYDGLFNLVYCFNRALTSGEVATLYNSGNGLAYPFGAGGGVNVSWWAWNNYGLCAGAA